MIVIRRSQVGSQRDSKNKRKHGRQPTTFDQLARLRYLSLDVEISRNPDESDMRNLSALVMGVALLFVFQSSMLSAQQSDKPAAKKPAKKSAAKKPAAKKVPPQFRPPEKIDPALPNVLLIGDSISIGYMMATRKELNGVANVFRPATNCGPTTKGLTEIDKWIGDRKWDVIHFNHGLHDLKFMGPKGQNLADPEADTSKPQVAIEQYAKNIKAIAERLKKTGATVIWCDTTPVPKGAKGRVVGDSKRYNDAARKVLAEVGGIEIDPLYDFALEHAEMQQKANVHYSPAGSAKLAEQVAKSIKAEL